jgi:putative transposase
MDESPTFNVFNNRLPAEIYQYSLPHWFRPGTAIFVSFRTNDSLPKPVLQRMHRELLEWLEIRKLPVALADSLIARRTAEQEILLESLQPEDRKNFHKLTAQLIHYSLDECHGTCPFRQPELAEIVGKHILHFDKVRYDVDCFVVMPNHVHAIVQFRQGFHLKQLGASWLQLSARRINELLGTSGAVWQGEPFDHLIRSGRQFEYLRRYITDNPLKAKLRPGEYLLYQREQFGFSV